jgi:SAM-dependent methyltransferase
MAKLNDPEHGVMDGVYADVRKKPEFEFRYKVRACVLADAVRKFLDKKRDLSVLDFGSAEGLTLIEMSRMLPTARFFGVEYSKGLMKCASVPDNVKIIHGDVMNLPADIKGRSFDVVSALAILTQLPNRGEAAVKEAAEVLNSGGIFVATLPEPRWDRIAIKFGLLPDKFSESPMGKSEVLSLIGKCGLVPVFYAPFMFFPIGFLPYLKVRVRPHFALLFDKIIRKSGLLNWAFVNQCVIARKP